MEMEYTMHNEYAMYIFEIRNNDDIILDNKIIYLMKKEN